MLTDVPHLPEDIISPLDIDDEGIVDTILELEESSMPPIDLSLSDDNNNIQVQMNSARPVFTSTKDASQDGYFGDATKQKQAIWNAPERYSGDYLEITDEPNDDAITPSLAAYACMALSNTTKGKSAVCKTSPSKHDASTTPIMSPVVYFSPAKQTPLMSRLNPTLSSALMIDDDQLVNTTKESYSDFSFASPLSASSLFSPSVLIDVDDIKEVKEVKKDARGKLIKDNETDLWDIDKIMEINSSLDELIDREVFLCSPKMMPRNFNLSSKDIEVPCSESSKMVGY